MMKTSVRIFIKLDNLYCDPCSFILDIIFYVTTEIRIQIQKTLVSNLKCITYTWYTKYVGVCINEI